MDARLLKDIFLADSLDQLWKSVETNVSQLGFRYFIYRGRFPHTHAGCKTLYFDNCPQGWGARYQEHNAEGGDHFLKARGTREVTPALWREMVPRAPALFAEARKFGLVTGCTHPVHGPDGQWSSMSFIKDQGGIDAEMEIRAELADCQLLAVYVHEAAAQIVMRQVNVAGRHFRRQQHTNGLNERERQVLQWAAAGKTMAGIADLLSISQRTVFFHMSNARRKLGAANTRHAIGKALSLGLIDVSGDPDAKGADRKSPFAG